MLKDKANFPFRFDSILQAPGVDQYRQRVLFVMLAVSVAFVVLLGRLFYLQMIQGEAFWQQSKNNSIRLQSIPQTRGLIYDRNGNLLVDDRPSYDLTIVLKDAKPVARTIETLSHLIDESPGALMEKINGQKGGGPYQPIQLKKDIDRDLVAVVEAHKYDLPGINVEWKPLRNYVEGKLAAHLIGYLSEINATELSQKKYSANRVGDFIGKVGIEKVYETYLRGERGGRQVEVSALGRVARVLKRVDPKPGDNIYLTIDEALQKKAEELLDGNPGAVAAMDPRTGEILAMVSSPSFDPNAFVTGMSSDEWDKLSSNPSRPLENKVIQGQYPPGSVYKILVAMAGLEEGVVDENTVYNCTGSIYFGDRSYHCWRWKYGGHGNISLVQALAQSCDIYFYMVGQQLGVDRIAWYATASGLGEATGIDLDHEASGLIPTAAWKKRRTNEAWQPGETLSIAIGQGYDLLTPLQALCLVAAVANGGDRYKPQVVKTIKSVEGKVLHQAEPVFLGRLPVSRETLDLVKKGLRQVVAGAHGTARQINLPDIEISGKTGTAQVVSRKEESAEDSEDEEESTNTKDHAWFVAYAPSENPQIAVAVIIEHGEHGSSAAAPIAREIIKTYLGGTEDTGKAVSENMPVEDIE